MSAYGVTKLPHSGLFHSENTVQLWCKNAALMSSPIFNVHVIMLPVSGLQKQGTGLRNLTFHMPSILFHSGVSSRIPTNIVVMDLDEAFNSQLWDCTL